VGADSDQAGHAGGARVRHHRPCLDGIAGQVAVVVGPADGRAHAVMRGNSGAPFTTGRPPGYPPHVTASGTRWSAGEPSSPMRAQIVAVARGTAGVARMATMRSASSASPSTASTAGPGSAFHGSLASRWALVSRTSRHVASRASDGWMFDHACAASRYALAATSASGLSARGAGPMPPHLLPTTVATRASRLPRLLARSPL